MSKVRVEELEVLSTEEVFKTKDITKKQENGLLFKTFSDMGIGKIATGEVVSTELIQSLYTNGIPVNTVVNNTTSNAGGASYKILTTAEKDASEYAGTEGYACIEINGSGYWGCREKERDLRILTLNEAIEDASALGGDTVIISDRGNGLFEYKTGQTANGYNIVACTGVPTLSLVERVKGISTRALPRDILGRFGIGQNVVIEAERCKLEKLRTDFLEFAVYTPITQDGRLWHRWLLTNRFNLGNSGAPRVINCSLAALNPAQPIVRTPSNNVSETTGSPTTVTKASADAVQVGTWSAPATVLTTTDVSWSSTVGDTCTYTITGAERLHLRGLYAGNGGIGKVTVKQAGVEIDENNYLLPIDHLVNFISTATGNTTMHIPLANGLDSSLTYTVEIVVDASNPVGNRVYQAGLLGYDDIAFNAEGIHGILLDASLGGQTNSMSVTSGTTAVYRLDDVTKIDWSYVETNVASVTEFTIYDSMGVEISTYKNSAIDAYGAGSTAKKVVVATDLTKGTYYLHVKNGKTKNVSSSAYRYYDYGAIGYNQELAGDIDSDEFDDFDMPKIDQDPNDGTKYMLIGAGNLEVAVGVRKTTESVGTEEFVGGIHGYETTPTMTVYADDVVIDFAGGVQYDTWLAKDLRFEFTTTLQFHVDATDFCNVDYVLSFSQVGYGVKTTKTTLADSYIHNDYSIMLNVPNTDVGTQGIETGGGFKYLAADTNYTLTSFDNSSTFIEPHQGSYAFINNEYSVVVGYTTKPVVPNQFAYPDYEVGQSFGLVQDRTDNTVKVYTRAFSGDYINGVLVPAGLTWEHSKMYRVYKGNYKLAFGI